MKRKTSFKKALSVCMAIIMAFGLTTFIKPTLVQAATFDFNDATAVYNSNTGALTIYSSQLGLPDSDGYRYKVKDLSKIKLSGIAVEGTPTVLSIGKCTIMVTNKEAINKQTGFDTYGKVTNGLMMEADAFVLSKNVGINMVSEKPSKEKTTDVTVTGFSTIGDKTVTAISATPKRLSSSNGGSVSIDIMGVNLNSTDVKLFDGTDFITPSSVSATAANFTTTLPNNISYYDITHTFTVYLNGIETDKSIRVTVPGPYTITSITANHSTLESNGGPVEFTINGNFQEGTSLRLSDGTLSQYALVVSPTSTSCTIVLPENNTSTDIVYTFVGEVGGYKTEMTVSVTVKGNPLLAKPIVSGIIANPVSLGSDGGSATITITGTNLDKTAVQLHDGISLQNTMTDTSTSATYTVNLPANNTNTDKVYTFTAYLDGVETDKRVSVTVMGHTSAGNATVTNITATPTSLGSDGGSATITITGTGLDNETVQLHDGISLQNTIENTSTSALYIADFPSNDTNEDKVYTFKLYLAGQETDKSVSVTVIGYTFVGNAMITNITATPASLGNNGGSATIAMIGMGLDRATVQMHDGISLRSTMKHTSTSALYIADLPSNNTYTDKVYTFTAYLNGIQTNKSVTVTVAKAASTGASNGSGSGGSGYVKTATVNNIFTLKESAGGKQVASFDITSQSISNGVMELSTTSERDSYIWSFNLAMMKELDSANQNGKLRVKMPNTTFELPFDVLDTITGLADYIEKNNLSLQDLSIDMTVHELKAEELEKAQAAYAMAYPGGKAVSGFYDCSFALYKNDVKFDVDINQFDKPLMFSIASTEKGNTILLYNESTKQFSFVPATSFANKSAAGSRRHNSIYVIAKNNVTFDDVKSADWYSSYVQKAANKALVSGTGDNLYEPNKVVTRAEFVQMVANGVQLNKINKGTKPYQDVSKRLWYYDAVMQAKSAGLLKQFSEDTFLPEQAITREEMAGILANAAAYENVTVPPTIAVDLSQKFSDYGNIDEMFQENMQTVYMLRIMQGTSATTFEPKGLTTRAQAATALVNMLKRFDKID